MRRRCHGWHRCLQAIKRNHHGSSPTLCLHRRLHGGLGGGVFRKRNSGHREARQLHHAGHSIDFRGSRERKCPVGQGLATNWSARERACTGQGARIPRLKCRWVHRDRESTRLKDARPRIGSGCRGRLSSRGTRSSRGRPRLTGGYGARGACRCKNCNQNRHAHTTE